MEGQQYSKSGNIQYGSIEPGDPALPLKHKIRLVQDRSAPLVLLVHGRAGNYDLMWTFARSLEGCNVIAPQAAIPDPVLPHSPAGLSWWLKETDIKDLKRISSEAASGMLDFIEQAKSLYGLTPAKSVAIGFSQGAALLSVCMQLSPSLFSGVALLAGFVIRLSDDPPDRLPDIFLAHGRLDDVVPLAKAQEGVRFLERKGKNVQVSYEDVGHKVGSSGMRALKEWLARQTAV